MNREQLLDLFSELACSTGFYARYLDSIYSMGEEEQEEYWATMERMDFKDNLQVILFVEEGIYPAHCEKPVLSDQDIKQAVASTICDMIRNNIVNDNGVESLRGWTEDGDVFFNMGMKDKEIERAMELVDKLETAIDTINQVLGEL